MEDIKISVIIPVYNVEKYLDTCLTSVLMQTFQDFEIICINDCSTDNTINILKRYAKKDDRIRLLFNETNSGSGYSRNRGLDIAKGKYIFFLDSDDWISLNAFELLYERCEKDSLDVLIYKNIIYSDNNSIFGNEKHQDEEFLHKYDGKIFNYLDLNKEIFHLPITPYNKVYKKSFLDENNICFSEDLQFHIKSILLANKVSYIPKILYAHRIYGDSPLENTYEKYIQYHDTINQLSKEEIIHLHQDSELIETKINNLKEAIKKIKEFNLFDEEYYKSKYNYDGELDPLVHYIVQGYKEGKNPVKNLMENSIKTLMIM